MRIPTHFAFSKMLPEPLLTYCLLPYVGATVWEWNILRQVNKAWRKQMDQPYTIQFLLKQLSERILFHDEESRKNIHYLSTLKGTFPEWSLYDIAMLRREVIRLSPPPFINELLNHPTKDLSNELKKAWFPFKNRIGLPSLPWMHYVKNRFPMYYQVQFFDFGTPFYILNMNPLAPFVLDHLGRFGPHKQELQGWEGLKQEAHRSRVFEYTGQVNWAVMVKRFRHAELQRPHVNVELPAGLKWSIGDQTRVLTMPLRLRVVRYHLKDSPFVYIQYGIRSCFLFRISDEKGWTYPSWNRLPQVEKDAILFVMQCFNQEGYDSVYNLGRLGIATETCWLCNHKLGSAESKRYGMTKKCISRWNFYTMVKKRKRPNEEEEEKSKKQAKKKKKKT